MSLKSLHCLILLVSFLFIGRSFAQIYCPSEEFFLGPVIRVSEDIYVRRLDTIFIATDIDFHDSLILMKSSLSTISNGYVLTKQIFDIDLVQSCRCVLKYNSNWNLIEKITFNSIDSIDTRRAYFWENNELEKSIMYDRQNKIFSSRVYTRDNMERTEISKEVLDDHEENFILNEYNSNNQVIKTYSLDSLSNRTLLASYEYDTLNRNVKTDVWNTNIRYDRHFINKYDALNRVILRDWFKRNGELITSDSITYDARSNILFERSYSFVEGYSKSSEHQYEYDEYGNWISKETWSIFMTQKYLRSRVIRKYLYLKK